MPVADEVCLAGIEARLLTCDLAAELISRPFLALLLPLFDTVIVFLAAHVEVIQVVAFEDDPG